MLAAIAAALSFAFTPPFFDHLLGLGMGERVSFIHARIPFLHRRDVALPLKLGNATQSQYAAAWAMVDEALDQVEEINKARLASPSRNHYGARRRGGGGGQQWTASADQSQPQSQTGHFKMTQELNDAAALVARVEALIDPQPLINKGNQTFGPPDTRAGSAETFWMESIARKGAWPWGKNSSHKV